MLELRLRTAEQSSSKGALPTGLDRGLEAVVIPAFSIIPESLEFIPLSDAPPRQRPLFSNSSPGRSRNEGSIHEICRLAMVHRLYRAATAQALRLDYAKKSQSSIPAPGFHKWSYNPAGKEQYENQNPRNGNGTDRHHRLRERRMGSGVESRRCRARFYAPSERRSDLHTFQAEGENRRAGLVPQSVYRWLNRRMSLAP